MNDQSASSARDPRDHYTNPGEGLLLGRMDTWYYLYNELLGTLEMGMGPLTARQGAGRFMGEHLARFLDAWGRLARPQELSISFNRVSGRPVGDGFLVEAREPQAVMQEVQERVQQVSADSEFMTVMRGHFDVLVTLRADDGTLQDRWLSRAARVYFASDWRDWSNAARLLALDPASPESHVHWSASVDLEVLSLFRRDNHAVLERVRHQWQVLRATHPEAKRLDIDDNHPDDWMIVTLAKPPADTPPDNQELYERNAPRLREAISRWEQATGHHFEWAVSLDD
jgi:hypothetical protein